MRFTWHTIRLASALTMTLALVPACAADFDESVFYGCSSNDDCGPGYWCGGMRRIAEVACETPNGAPAIGEIQLADNPPTWVQGAGIPSCEGNECVTAMCVHNKNNTSANQFETWMFHCVSEGVFGPKCGPNVCGGGQTRDESEVCVIQSEPATPPAPIPTSFECRSRGQIDGELDRAAPTPFDPGSCVDVAMDPDWIYLLVDFNVVEAVDEMFYICKE